MNKRIQELARKANMVEVHYSPGFPDIRYPKNFEKFSELLVRECIHRMGDEIIYNDAYKEQNKVISDMMEIVKQHFGVGE